MFLHEALSGDLNQDMGYRRLGSSVIIMNEKVQPSSEVCLPKEIKGFITSIRNLS